MSAYRICSRCVMDTTDPTIKFNNAGVCSHCQNFDTSINPNWIDGSDNDQALLKLADKIRRRNSYKDFDCVIGLSGGLDSSYAAHVAVKKMGLRPLLFHVDAGWNTDIAVSNIKSLMDGLGLELITDVIDYDLVAEAQLAFLRSGIADQDLVQDALFFSGLYKFARKYRITDIITGSNFSTECCREPEAWGGYLGIDKVLFNDIFRIHGDFRKLKKFPLVDILIYKIYYQRILGMRMHYPLNLTNYVKHDAEKILMENYGWKAFKHKHHESRFTRFYEDFWLPKRFGFEKRRAHFSSLILTQQMTRNEALDRLKTSEMDENFLKLEFEFIANKLSISTAYLNELFEQEHKTYADYRNKRDLIRLGARVLSKLGLERRNI